MFRSSPYRAAQGAILQKNCQNKKELPDVDLLLWGAKYIFVKSL